MTSGSADAETDEDVVYREDARSYRSLVWSPLVVPVGFGLDLLVSGRHGALVHLPGWLVFGAILVGIQWLLLHAVRSTHSLRVTANELEVGDETLPRAQIAGVAASTPSPDVNTLGWPNGFPRGPAALLVRLVDGSDVLVPTRFPDRLLQALDAAPLEPVASAEVRPALDDDFDTVPLIDERADTVFRVAGFDLPYVPFDDGGLRTAALVLVVGRPAVGYAWVDEVDGDAHLHQVAVLPGSMRRGLGSRLLEAACDWAAAHGYASMTLTTFVDVPWNAPYYAARGFRPEPAPGPGLQALRAQEMELGLDAVGPRVVMRRPLSTATSA
ncbi:GNAT family N-acetyltransferase [uncultured Jatrophihabitans sp.]|uniref:GNAT family N-acetyltransferase n=1 Tax=uncultured Jatrophihabitans sp. TaxID=1610747 RepID=UPI0035CC4D6A